MKKLRILYDGECHLCHREISHYLKKDIHGKLEGVDIKSSEFDIAQYNLIYKDVDTYLHAIDENDKVVIGVDAFIEIWKRVPGFNWAIALFSNFFIKKIVTFGYIIFARYIRRLLPKRRCGDGGCEI